MHRATPLNSSFRGYSSGGARTTIDKVDDKQTMQEMGGNMMKGETRDKVESPQNYGFTSVVADADKDKDGKVTGSAEGFMSFMGGSRSFPVCAIMDDRRHRLNKLDKGSSAMYGLKEWGQQFLIHKDGMFASGSTDRKIRLQLVANKNGQQQQQTAQAPSAGTHAAGAGAGASGGAAQQPQQQKATGQESLHGESSSAYYDISAKTTEQVNKEHVIMLDDKETAVHLTGGEVYLGGKKGQGKFSRVITEDGVSKNVWARIA